MQSLSQLIPIDTTGISRVKPIDTTDTNYAGRYENDELFDQLSDLVSADWRPWYCKHFYRLGKDRVLQLAGVARAEGRSPKKYFARLLKQAL